MSLLKRLPRPAFFLISSLVLSCLTILDQSSAFAQQGPSATFLENEQRCIVKGDPSNPTARIYLRNEDPARDKAVKYLDPGDEIYIASVSGESPEVLARWVKDHRVIGWIHSKYLDCIPTAKPNGGQISSLPSEEVSDRTAACREFAWSGLPFEPVAITDSYDLTMCIGDAEASGGPRTRTGCTGSFDTSVVLNEGTVIKSNDIICVDRMMSNFVIRTQGKNVAFNTMRFRLMPSARSKAAATDGTLKGVFTGRIGLIQTSMDEAVRKLKDLGLTKQNPPCFAKLEWWDGVTTPQVLCWNDPTPSIDHVWQTDLELSKQCRKTGLGYDFSNHELRDYICIARDN